MRVIDGGADRRDEPQAGAAAAGDGASADAPAAVLPPDYLTGGELEVWRELAPLAEAAQTLTLATRPAFAHLCQLEAERRELRARYGMRRDPETGVWRPLLVMDSAEELSTRREVRTLTKDIKAAMKDFAIAPFGKGVDGAGDVPEADPLDAFTRRRG